MVSPATWADSLNHNNQAINGAVSGTGPAHVPTNPAAPQLTALQALLNNGNLTVPKGVVTVIDFGNAATLSIPGNFSNAGTVYAISTNPSVNLGILNALNIFNRPGALFSSVFPISGLPG